MIVEVRHRTHVQRMTWEDFENRIRDGEITAQTHVRFEVVTGDEFVPAGNLELFQALADPHRRAFRQNLSRSGVPIVTALLVGVQLRIYLWSWAPGAEAFMQDHFTNWAPAVLEQGEVWRLFTYGLLHVSFTHLLFNLLFLAYAGYHLERAMGRANLLLLFFGSVFAGGVLSMGLAPFADPVRPSLGASGGDFGLLGAAVVLGWKHWEAIPSRARKYYGWALAPYPAVSILTGISAQLVDNWSHLGGLVGGVILVTVLEPEALAGNRRTNRTVRRLVVGVMALVSVGLAAHGQRLVPLITSTEQTGLLTARPVYWKDGWTITGDRGWFSPTGSVEMAASTTVHARPLDADEAVANLVARIGSGGRNVVTVTRQTETISGLAARRVVLHFEHSGKNQEMTALIITRGVYEHRVQFLSEANEADRYDPLAERIERSVRITEVDELVEARQRVTTHPRSWEPAAQLGRALYRTGEPVEALRAYERAITLSPHQPAATEGLLRVYADYAIPGGLGVALEALARLPDDPSVVVAACDVMDSAGETRLATVTLDDTWTALPGDRVLRRARLQRGLPVD